MKWQVCDIRELTAEDYESAYSMLSPEEKSRVEGLRFREDRQRTLAARHLARRLVAQWCNLPESAVRFAKTQMGKLYPVGLAAEISVSHSGDLVACAISDRPVGIDLERLRPVELRLAKKICTTRELCYLFGRQPEAEDFCYTEDPVLTERFFRLWTGKEACAKRQGKGIGSLHRYDTGDDNLLYHKVGQYLVCISQE